jgi:hypothetical protein
MSKEVNGSISHSSGGIGDDSEVGSSIPFDLEDNDLVCQVIEMAQPIHLWDAELSPSDFERDYPHRAYVVDVEYRLLRLVDRFHSLRLVDKMLSMADLPITTPAGSISRYEWVRIVKDAILGRVTSVRDCAFLLVAEIYELRLEPRRVTLKTIEDVVDDQAIKEIITAIANVGSQLRDERDRHLHRGEEAALHGDMDVFYKLAAMFEPTPPPKSGRMDQDGGHNVGFNLVEAHQSVVAEIAADFHEVSGDLFALVERLLEAINEEFDHRWAEKRDAAKEVRDWEKS